MNQIHPMGVRRTPTNQFGAGLVVTALKGDHPRF